MSQYMIPRAEIEQALRRALPEDSQDQVLYLSVLLHGLINQTVNPEVFSKQITEEPAATQAYSSLAGTTIKSERGVISFGEGSQMGDVSVSDIAGNNIFKTHITISVHNYNRNSRTIKTSSQRNTKAARSATTHKSPRNYYKNSSKAHNISTLLEATNIHLIPGDIWYVFKIGIFPIFGILFGWYIGYNIVSPADYGIYELSEYAIPAVSALIGFGVGLLIGLELSSKKRRASGVAWWGHILGTCFIGTLAMSSPENSIPGVFWIAGILGWGAFWFVFLGGYRELR